MDLRPRRPSSRRSSTTDPHPASFPDLAATPPRRNPLAVAPFKSTPSAAANAHTRPSLPSLSTACSVGGNGGSKRDRRCCPLKSESSFVQLVLICSNLPLLLPALPVPTTWSSSSGNGSLQQQRAVAQDMLKIYNDFIGSGERRRIERLELFDEFEEWHMMQEHYCVAYGINDAEGIFEDFGFKE